MARLRASWIGLLVLPGLLVIGLSGLLAATTFTADTQKLVVRQWHGVHGGSAEMRVESIRSPKQWALAWQGLERPPPSGLPSAADQIGVLIALGTKPTAGYAARLISATVNDGRLIVVGQQIEPDPQQETAQILTQPWLLVLLDSDDLPVVVEQRFR